METVIIQKLIGPSKEVCNEWGMYFRKVDKEGNDITTYPYDDGDVMFHKLIDGVKASEVAAESFPLEIKQGEILSLEEIHQVVESGIGDRDQWSGRCQNLSDGWHGRNRAYVAGVPG